MVKVIASEVRKGNVLEIDGVLCTVVKAESVRPGKGTPTTHLDVRRISDGVKLNKSYRTTENVERAFLDEVNYKDRKSTRLNSSHRNTSRMPSSA